MSKALFVFLMVFSMTAFAQSEDIRLGEDKINDYFIRVDSFSAQKDVSGLDVLAATLKTIQKKTYNISYNHYVLAQSTCERGMGKIIEINKYGDVEQIQNVKIDGKTKIDAFANAICFMNTVHHLNNQKTPISIAPSFNPV